MAAIKLGDHFIAKCGKVLEVVDKKQRRQTRGYDVGPVEDPIQHEDIQYYTRGYAWAAFAWLIDRGIFVPGRLYLCPVSELDEMENEWGPVCP